jgi:ribulose-phosphate 3-epimerase
MIKIAPSILAADFLRLGEQIKAVERAGADRIHVDVMDGQFVPNISLGFPLVEAIRRATSLPLEAHLMIERPERYLERFAQAGADHLIVHQETSLHLDRTVQLIRHLRKKVGVALNPATPAEVLDEIIEELDIVLVMTVNPGFGGQQFIRRMIKKIRQVRQTLDNRNANCELEVDGGIEPHTAPLAVSAGACVLVAGTAIFNHPDGSERGVQDLVQTVA